jgi:hypothetical protein
MSRRVVWQIVNIILEVTADSYTTLVNIYHTTTASSQRKVIFIVTTMRIPNLIILLVNAIFIGLNASQSL